MRRLIALAFLVLAGIVVYNLYFGTEEEKKQSQNIINQVQQIGVSITEVVKSEKDKIEDGKYDKVFEKLGDLYESLRQGAQHLDENMMRKLESLEKKKDDLDKKQKDLNSEPNDEERAQRKSEIDKELEQLYQETKDLWEKLKSDTK